MRATGRLCALLGALLAFLPVSVAEAKIAPVPKPAGIVAKPAAGHSGSLIAPVSRPVARTPIRTSRPHIVASRPSRKARTPARKLRKHAFVPARSHGGRERSWRVLSSGGRDNSALLPPPVIPTPLGFAGADEAQPVYAYAWPAWKIVLLTLLALSEGFVLVRLARDRRSVAMSQA